MGPIRSPSGESARHEDAQKRLISATAAAQKRRVGGLAYEIPAALRGWRSGEQAGTCSAVLGAAGESRERGRGWPPRAAKAKYRTIFSTGEATRRSNGPGQPREAAPRKSRKPRNGTAQFRSASISTRILLSGRHRNGRDSLLRCLCAVLAASFRTPYLDFKAKMPCQKRALSPLRGVRMKVLDLSSRYHQI